MKNKIIIILLGVCFLIPQVSSAQLLNFGGKIVAMHECFCSGGWMIYVYDPGKKVVLPIVFQFGLSGLSSAWNIYTPGVSVLGNAVPSGICTLASTACEVTLPAAGTITPIPGMGTSLLPSL